VVAVGFYLASRPRTARRRDPRRRRRTSGSTILVRRGSLGWSSGRAGRTR